MLNRSQSHSCFPLKAPNPNTLRILQYWPYCTCPYLRAGHCRLLIFMEISIIKKKTGEFTIFEVSKVRVHHPT